MSKRRLHNSSYPDFTGQHSIPDYVLFWSKVDKYIGGECWTWLGKANDNGYGRFKCRNVNYQAHRWAYERTKGKIPLGLTVDHLCFNKLCVNPEHLEVKTIKANINRWQEIVKTHCKYGHPLAGAGSDILYSRSGQRICRACQRIWNKQFRQRIKDKK